MVIFGKYGEAIQQHITKGREIFASGRLDVNDKGYISLISDHIELLRRPMDKTGEKESQEMSEPEEKKNAGQPKKNG